MPVKFIPRFLAPVPQSEEDPENVAAGFGFDISEATAEIAPGQPVPESTARYKKLVYVLELLTFKTGLVAPE